MKIKKVIHLSAAVVVSLSTFLVLSSPLVHAATVSCFWTDHGDNTFSDPNDWSCSGGAAPSSGSGNVYNLTFPASAFGFSPVLDISGMTVGSMTFTGGGYDLTALDSSTNTITLTGGITDSSGGPNNEIDLNINVSDSQSFSTSVNSRLVLSDGTENVNVGSNNLTLGNVLINGPVVGTGTLTVSDSNYSTDLTGVGLEVASPSFSGNVQVSQGALFVDAPGALTSPSQVTVASGALLKGDGSIFNATIQSGGTIAPGHSPGCIAASSLTINGTYLAQIGGTNPCTDYDQINVSNSINITNGTLKLSLINTPSVGQSFEIVNNTGNNPVTGTFSGLAEGSTFTAGGATFRITYRGGNGNDVTLTVINAPASSSRGGASTKSGGTTVVPTPKAPNTGVISLVSSPDNDIVISALVVVTIMAISRYLKPAKY